MISKRLKKLRSEKGITQQQAADRLKISRSTYAGYEAENKLPSYDVLILIAKEFNVTTDYLLGLIDEQIPYGYTSFDKNFPLHEEKFKSNIQYLFDYTTLEPDELCSILGINQDALTDYMENEVKPPLPIIKKLAELCEVSTDFLLGLRKESRPPHKSGEIPYQFDEESSLRLKQIIGKNYDYYGQIMGMDEIEVAHLIEYGFISNVVALIKLAKDRHVSVDYLLNMSDSKLSVLTSKEEKLLSTFRKLNEDNQDITVGDMLKELKLQEREDYEKTLAVADASVEYGTSPGKSLPLNGTEGVV